MHPDFSPQFIHQHARDLRSLATPSQARPERSLFTRLLAATSR